MAELRRALARQLQQRAGDARPQQQQFLCPVFHSISVKECCSSGFRQLYEQQPWDSFNLQEPKPPAHMLDRYAGDVAELCTITGLRQDQVGSHCGCLAGGPLYDGRARCSVHGKGVLSSRGPHIMADVMSGPLAQARFYQGQLASMAVDSVIRCLQQAGRLPQGYSLGKPQCYVPANARPLIGRDEELQQVLKGLLGDTRCVVISGGPGEGKSALAQAAVWQLREQAMLPGGAYTVNLAGEPWTSTPVTMGQVMFPANRCVTCMVITCASYDPFACRVSRRRRAG